MLLLKNKVRCGHLFATAAWKQQALFLQLPWPVQAFDLHKVLTVVSCVISTIALTFGKHVLQASTQNVVVHAMLVQ